MVSEDLVRSALYNWLGYGNLNGKVWFIGTEEGGAEIWRKKTKDLKTSLELRSKFNITMDFKYTWETLYEIPLETFKGPCVWRYMAAFLLAIKESDINTDSINNYVFNQKKIGALNSSHFLCELLPLPKKSKTDISTYRSIWKNIKEYHNEVIPKRFELIRETLLANSNVELILSYEKILTANVLNFFNKKSILVESWKHKNEEYKLYQLEINDNRTIYLLSTPFFGNGRISYDGVKSAAIVINKYIQYS